jgi:uncharacterized UPF0160 family protein
MLTKIVTHDGFFHADEVFALAVLSIYFEKNKKEMEIIRTRDLEKIDKADMAVDVGNEYDHKRGRFDHHQKGKVGNHDNGLPYAAFGLVWKHFGSAITSKMAAEYVEQKLVTPIDALDNAIDLSTPIYEGIREYTNANIIAAIGRAYGDNNLEVAFKKALEFAVLVINGEVKNAEVKLSGEKLIIEEIVKQSEPKVLILEKYIPWGRAVNKYKNVLLIVFPDNFTSKWCVQTVKDDPEKMDSDRIKFPEVWRGLTNEELEKASGVAGATFCHASGFFAVNKTKEGAIAMAKKTLSKS